MNQIYDCDRHVIEPIDIWREFVDKDIFDQYPIRLEYDTKEAALQRVATLGAAAGVKLPPTYMIGDIPTLFAWDDKMQLACVVDGANNHQQRKSASMPESQLDEMDKTGVTFARLHPTFATFLVNNEQIPPHVSLAYANAYNKWLKSYCDYDPSRLKGVGIISRLDTDSMLSQLNTVLAYNWSCITIRPEMINGRDLGHVDHESFWASCEKHNISITIHGGSHAFLNTAGTQRFTSHFALHACSHPLEIQMAFLSLLEAGVLERYPKLKFAFLEAGSAWVPYWLWRLDNICYPEFPSLTKQNMKMLPSQYFKRQCWVAIEPGEPNLRETINWIGHERLLFGSDFPHPDHAHIDVENIAADCPELSDLELNSILHQNPRDFFETV